MMTGREDDSCHLVENPDSAQQLWSPNHGPQEVKNWENVFSDGKTVIDFVLVWKSHSNEEEDNKCAKRQAYLETLKKNGILMEQHSVPANGATVNFMLLSAPFTTLCSFAEDMKMRVPLQVQSADSPQRAFTLFECLFQDEVPRQPPKLLTCHFRKGALERYLGSSNKESFFTATQRHQIMYQILARAQYGNTCDGEVGVESLLQEEVFSDAYPLHEGEFTNTQRVGHMRQVLFKYWASWGKWHKTQPLDHIREYFGEKITLYFAWLGLYTFWLIPAAIVGTVIFTGGFFMRASDIPAKELCESDGKFNMCPICSTCPYWNLSSICRQYRDGLLFDNTGTMIFSLLMSIWAVGFLQHWKRLNATLSYQWDCWDYRKIEETPRPEFAALATMTAENPVTGVMEPHFPDKQRIRRILTSYMVIILMMAVVVIALVSVIIYRLIISVVVGRSNHEFLRSSANDIAGTTGSLINLAAILLLSRIYLRVALFLSRWEMHRTQSQYEDAFIFKVHIFEFVNYYSAPIYIAFFKGRFVGYPGHYTRFFQFRNEECSPGGCLNELAQLLLIIMVGKQLLNNLIEMICPKLIIWWRDLTYKAETKEEVLIETPWERDYKLVPYAGLVDEYLEMVIQYGFVTIFVAACPLAPLLALVNNLIEVRLDARKLVCEYRRPVAERAQSIGIWMTILKCVTCIAIIGNAFLVAFTSDFLPRFYYRYFKKGDMWGYVNFSLSTAPEPFIGDHKPCLYRALRDAEGKLTPDFWTLMVLRLGSVITFVLIVFLLGQLIDLLVPDIPKSIDTKVKREEYLAKEALAEHEALHMEQQASMKSALED